MKKLERLAWIERTYGSRFVSPYKACYNWCDLRDALVDFEARGLRPSIRTDLRAGAKQGYLLPFLFFTNVEAAHELFMKHQFNLVYIVSASVQPVLVQGVAERLDADHVFFEINTREPMISQRDMYKKGDQCLREFVVGPSSAYPRVDKSGVRMFPCYNPEWMGVWSLDQVYAAMFNGGADELTFSVKATKEVVIW